MMPLTATALLCLLGMSAWAQTAGVIVSPSLPSIPGFDMGELLLGELNCAACHPATAAVQVRLASRASPRLGEAGLRLTPQYLRAFLANPQIEQPGTTMPDLLHALSASEKTETVDALVHFLTSLSRTNDPAPAGADQFKMQQGRSLYHQVGCVACHAPVEAAAALQSKPNSPENGAPASAGQTNLAGLQTASVPLGNLAKKTTVEELTKFLMDPLKVRPSGRMPSLNLGEGEATAMAMYLLRDQAPGVLNPSSALQRIKGLSYQYFETQFDESPNFDALKVTSSGFIDRFTIAPRRRQDNVGFRFTGFVTGPAAGTYTFYTVSDDGSRLYIGDKLVVDNYGMHGATEKNGAIALPAGDHPIQVTWYNGGGDGVLRVLYQGPGIRKREIPASALSHMGQPMVPVGEEKFAVDPEKAMRGQQLFASLGCAACHQLGQEPPGVAAKLNAKPLASLNPQSADGCLSERVKPGLPRYPLGESQRAALRAILAAREKLSRPLPVKEQITRTMAALNCFACHSRDGIGGPAPSRAEYFTVLAEADLGDEGRIPPHLTRVGDKLRPEWLREVLLNQGKVRPYMATRMPQFGAANVEPLVSAFEQADRSGPPETRAEYSARDAKFGRRLVGREGLTCISCHTFAQFKSLGIPAMDMTQMTRRLKKDWFHRYLLDPASLRPGTRMPTFWPEGKAVNKEILEGNTERQVEAIWTYLSKGREADVPLGLVRAKMEIVADTEAVIYRNFIQGAGSRAIAVGYPEKANLAFDANDLRLALIWQGAFIDASHHRTDRGAGFEPPLGDHVTQMPPGAPFAVLADAGAPWPDTVGKQAGYQMRGYQLDDKRRPAFHYSFQNIQIEDYPVAVAGELDPGFTRTLTLRAGQPVNNLWFRAAVGSQIEAKDDGFVVDGKMTLKFKNLSLVRPITRQIGGRAELIVPVVFAGNEAKLVEEIIW